MQLPWAPQPPRHGATEQSEPVWPPEQEQAGLEVPVPQLPWPEQSFGQRPTEGVWAPQIVMSLTEILRSLYASTRTYRARRGGSNRAGVSIRYSLQPLELDSGS